MMCSSIGTKMAEYRANWKTIVLRSAARLPPPEKHRSIAAAAVLLFFQVAPKWRANYETLTGRPFNDVRCCRDKTLRRLSRWWLLTLAYRAQVKERTRCVAVAAGLQEVVRSGCALPKCNPDVGCGSFC